MLDRYFKSDFIVSVEDFAGKNGYYFPMNLRELKKGCIEDEDMMEALTLAVVYVMDMLKKKKKIDNDKEEEQ